MLDWRGLDLILFALPGDKLYEAADQLPVWDGGDINNYDIEDGCSRCESLGASSNLEEPNHWETSGELDDLDSLCLTDE